MVLIFSVNFYFNFILFYFLFSFYGKCHERFVIFVSIDNHIIFGNSCYLACLLCFVCMFQNPFFESAIGNLHNRIWLSIKSRYEYLMIWHATRCTFLVKASLFLFYLSYFCLIFYFNWLFESYCSCLLCLRLSCLCDIFIILSSWFIFVYFCFALFLAS